MGFILMGVNIHGIELCQFVRWKCSVEIDSSKYDRGVALITE